MPSSVTRVKLGPRPRRLICWPSPFVREICTPGMRAMASARLLSGSLPTSSAEIESTKFVEARFVSSAFSRLLRKPETTTSSMTSEPASSAACALAMDGASAPRATEPANER
jgi:hypothetical protein